MLKKALLLLAILAIVVVVAVAIVPRTVVIRNYASVKTIGLESYWDVNATIPCTEISWGMLEPGESVNKTIYVKSVSNVASTLNMTTQNWNPMNASNLISLTWDSEGKTIQPNEVMAVSFMLQVSPTITGIREFSFDIIIACIA